MKSAIEISIIDFVYKLRKFVRTKDRAVVIGFFLACIPIFPACLVGLLISFLNRILIRKNKIHQSEQKLVNYGLIIGFLFTISWLLLFYQFGNLLFLPIEVAIDLIKTLLNLFDRMFQTKPNNIINTAYLSNIIYS